MLTQYLNSSARSFPYSSNFMRSYDICDSSSLFSQPNVTPTATKVELKVCGPRCLKCWWSWQSLATHSSLLHSALILIKNVYVVVSIKNKAMPASETRTKSSKLPFLSNWSKYLAWNGTFLIQNRPLCKKGSRSGMFEKADHPLGHFHAKRKLKQWISTALQSWLHNNKNKRWRQ